MPFGLAGIGHPEVVFGGDGQPQDLGDDLCGLCGARRGARVYGGHAAGRKPPRGGGGLLAAGRREAGAGGSGDGARVVAVGAAVPDHDQLSRAGHDSVMYPCSR